MPYEINNNIFYGVNKLQEKTHGHSVMKSAPAKDTGKNHDFKIFDTDN
jgi:hypothetical protein